MNDTNVPICDATTDISSVLFTKSDRDRSQQNQCLVLDWVRPQRKFRFRLIDPLSLFDEQFLKTLVKVAQQSDLSFSPFSRSYAEFFTLWSVVEQQYKQLYRHSMSVGEMQSRLKKLSLVSISVLRPEWSSLCFVSSCEYDDQELIVELHLPLCDAMTQHDWEFFDHGVLLEEGASPNAMRAEIDKKKKSRVEWAGIRSSEMPEEFLKRENLPHPESPTFNKKLHCQSLEEHRTWLKSSFQTASHELWIVSPFVSQRALTADTIVDRIQNAVSRGIRIVIMVDSVWVYGNSSRRNNTLQAIQNMVTAGAEVYGVPNLHAKIVIIDDTVLAEGSFNWLSAERTRLANTRLDTTQISVGSELSTWIADTKALLSRAVVERFDGLPHL